MAQIPVPNANIVETSSGAYKWSGFVSAVLTGSGTLDDLIIPNRLSGQRRPTYMRIYTPVEYIDDPGQPGPVPLAAGLGAWPEVAVNLILAIPEWHMEDHVLVGNNALWFCVTEAGVAPQDERMFFIEYGIEHSVEK
jgi:hypothetical protein